MEIQEWKLQHGDDEDENDDDENEDEEQQDEPEEVLLWEENQRTKQEFILQQAQALRERLFHRRSEKILQHQKANKRSSGPVVPHQVPGYLRHYV